jgi:glycosyltransferase involved in cell wall biosynthesis
MVEVRDRLWPKTPVFALVHGTLPVEFPPARPEITIPAINGWFTATKEAQTHLADTYGLESSLLGNVFRGAQYWGERPERDMDAARSHILFAGTLTAGKTQPLYALIRGLGGTGWSLTIAGDGPERERISGLAEEIGVRSMVHLLGNVADIRDFLLKADIFIGAGRAAIEAGSSGIPVIVANSDGLHGLVTPHNFEVAEAANFTGRSTVSVPNETPALRRELQRAIDARPEDIREVSDRFWNIGDIEPLLESIVLAHRSPDA